MRVPDIDHSLKLKHWWTKELTKLRAHTNKLGRLSYQLQQNTLHNIHAEHKEVKSKYKRTLKLTKQQHWREWLEKADEPDLWTAHRTISAPASNGGKVKILALKVKRGEEEITASMNDEKSKALAKGFFPTKP